jgi:hypothetical protein
MMSSRKRMSRIDAQGAVVEIEDELENYLKNKKAEV